MIIILDVGVTAERRHYNTHRREVAIPQPSARRAVAPFYTTCGGAAPLFYKNCGGAATTTL